MKFRKILLACVVLVAIISRVNPEPLTMMAMITTAATLMTVFDFMLGKYNMLAGGNNKDDGNYRQLSTLVR